MAKVRLCKRCGTEVRTISEAGIIETTGVENPGWSLVEGVERVSEEGFKYSPTEKVGGLNDKAEWKGQYHCPKCDPGVENFFNIDQTEVKDISALTREQEIELSKKAKEEVEQNEPSVIWGEGEEPGKGWN